MSDKFVKILNEAGQEVNNLIKEDIKQFNGVINAAKGILRFIDKQIITGMHYNPGDNTPKGLRPRCQYYPQRGIMIFVENRDYEDIEVEENEIFGGIDETTKWFRDGEEIFLLRNGTLILFERTGYTHDPRDPNPYDLDLHLTNEQTVTLSDIADRYDFDDFRKSFYRYLKKHIIDAIKLNEKKQPILKKIIDYLNAIERREKNK